jgi:hypothetical protein
MTTKRIYVTPADIKKGGVWNGWGKDAVSRAMSRALGKKVTVGGTIFVSGIWGKDYQMGSLPVKVQKRLLASGIEKPIVGPRFNFRVQVVD